MGNFRLILILVLSHWSLCQAAGISAIEIQGNTVTNDDVILQELGFSRGDTIEQGELLEARQNLQNLGLFRQVSVMMNNNQTVVIRVKEKKYFLALPEFRQVENTDFTFGGYIYLDNIAGTNQKVKLRYKAQEVEQGLYKSLSLYYNNHRIGRSRFGFSLAVSNIKQPIEHKFVDENKVDLSFTRWITLLSPSKGLRMRAGILNRLRKIDNFGAIQNDDSFALTYDIEWLNVNNHIYSRSGHSFKLRNQYGIDALSSNYTYNKHELIYKLYYPLHSSHQNINFQLGMGYSSESVFNEPAFDLGGRRGIRAYKEIKGNHYVQLRSEFLTPIIKKRKSLRANFFADLGNAYENESDIDLTKLKLSLGFGMNIKINYLVNMELKLENAYSLSDNSYRFYIFISK